MRSLTVKADANGGFPTWCRVPSDTINSFTLAAGVARVATVPALAGRVFFSADTDYYVKHNAAAAVPADVSNGSASELNPSCYIVSPGDTLGIISAVGGSITLTYYK